MVQRTNLCIIFYFTKMFLPKISKNTELFIPKLSKNTEMFIILD